MNTITVVVIPLDAAPYDTRIDPTDFAAAQNLVGGPIEPINLSDMVTLWVNQEGHLRELPVNTAATRLLLDHWPDYPLEILGQAYVTGPDAKDVPLPGGGDAHGDVERFVPHLPVTDLHDDRVDEHTTG